ncbi:MAG TPA: hypothetical protein PLY87_19690, partial [Planctomycetaceae bacterium]|nr:hypothetical protein [Planctomycetaceae bacterium]
QCSSWLSRIRGPVWFATLLDDIRESMKSAISNPRTSFRLEPDNSREVRLEALIALFYQEQEQRPHTDLHDWITKHTEFQTELKELIFNEQRHRFV